MNQKQIEQMHHIFLALEPHGFTFEEVHQLRRIEMTLNRWAEGKCGNGNNYASWAIERDEETGTPYMVTRLRDGRTTRCKIADREKGARARAEALCRAHGCRAFFQPDPRGCSLYVIRPGDLKQGEAAEAYYTRGVGLGV